MQCNHNISNEKSCIEGVPIFNSLTLEELNEVILTSVHRSYEKGEFIFREGQNSERLYVINSGKVKISKYSESGKEQIIRILGPGDFMGELSLFVKSLQKTNAESLENTTICILDNKKINNLIEKIPTIAIKIMTELSERLEKTESLIESIGLKDVEKRLADILLDMAENNDIVNLEISKKDLASHFGMSQETLSRKLSSFQDIGLIKLVGQRKIIILDRAGLENIQRNKY